MKKFLKIICKFVIALAIAVTVITTVINIGIIAYGSLNIKSIEQANGEYDCIIILGTSVYGDTPSVQLQDRLDCGIELYKAGKCKYIIVSGDGMSDYYDEATVMYNYLIENGIDKKAIYVDKAGLSTYDSLYRVKELLDVKCPLIVTQKYHLYRAVFIARCLDMDAVGVAANKDGNNPISIIYRNFREIFSRVKSIYSVIMKPESEYLTEIPIE
jgi:SanA protein